jgi:DNA-binding cell septation regulator SpoVG
MARKELGSQKEDTISMEIMGVTVEIRFSARPGSLRAYADVQIQTSNGILLKRGYAVIQKEGNPPFVGFPSRQGKIPGKFFPIVEAEGDIRMMIIDAILAAYGKASKQ